MDEKDRRFMGAHSYCTQELVNLLTTGVATSNVFDGDRDLGGGIILHGVHVRFFFSCSLVSLSGVCVDRASPLNSPFHIILSLFIQFVSPLF